MHFVIATPYYPSRVDPTAGNFIHRQVIALAGRGHRMDVIHIQPRPLPLRGLAARWRARLELPEQDAWDGVSIFRARYLSTTQRAPLRRFQAIAIAHAVGGVLRRYPELACADVMYAQWLVPYGYGALLAARRVGLPCMAIARGGDLNLWATPPAVRRQLLRLVGEADAVLGNGRYVRRELARIAGRPITRPIDVVHNPCDLSPFFRLDRDDARLRHAARRALGLPVDRPLLLFVGQLDVRKGPDTTLEALSLLDPRWHLALAGTGDLASKLRTEAARAGTVDRVHFLGAVAYHTIPTLMAAADVLVQPSRREGLPNAVVEGLAAALPVVATPVGGTPEVVIDGRTGWLVPPGRPDSLASAIATAHGNPAEARRRGAAGRAYVRRLFDLERNLSRLETIAARLQPAPRRVATGGAE